MQRKISNLDLKVKLANEYLNNGGMENIFDIKLLNDLKVVKPGNDGKIDPNTVSSSVNAFMMAILATHLRAPLFSVSQLSEYQSTLQKSIFFDQDNIETAEDFERVYAEFKDKKGHLFRGQREAKWPLYSTLQRSWILDKLNLNFSTYTLLIESLVDGGRNKYRDTYIENIGKTDEDVDNDIAVLSYLQHHSCPTPLLDWTYRFQNALYFAMDGVDATIRNREIDDYFSIYFINENDFSSGGMRELLLDSIEGSQGFALDQMIAMVTDDPTQQEILKAKFAGRKAIDLTRINGSGMIAYMLKAQRLVNFPITYFTDAPSGDIVFSLNNSANITSQAGVFTWNGHPFKPLEVLSIEQYMEVKEEKGIDDEHSYYKLCECFNIHKKLAPYIKSRLEADGITGKLIYPTPDINTKHIYNECITTDKGRLG